VSTAGLMDATRLSENATVAIKCRKDDDTAQNELDVRNYLGSLEFLGCLDNHCVPLLEVLKNPDERGLIFFVEPWLSQWDYPQFETVYDVTDFIEQTLEGLAFLHEAGVVHGNIGNAAIAMDGSALHPGIKAHPWNIEKAIHNMDTIILQNRHKARVTYFFVDFSMSFRFDEKRAGASAGLRERSPEQVQDATASDVFNLGKLYLQEFYARYDRLGFLRPLLNRMMEQDLNARVTAGQALHIFRALQDGMSKFTGWRRLSKRSECLEKAVALDIAYAGVLFFGVR